MTFVVPFDGSSLSEAALERAVEIGGCCEKEVIAVTILPQDREYATERGWLDQGEAFDDEQIAERLRDAADEAGASVVFLGSENAGRIAKPLGSIADNVAARVDYDIDLVQSR